jgi:hypothetical protein
MKNSLYKKILLTSFGTLALCLAFTSFAVINPGDFRTNTALAQLSDPPPPDNATRNSDGTINYVPLADLPGVDPQNRNAQGEAGGVDIGKYAAGLFNLAIGISAALSVIIITIGGFEYIGSSSFTSKSSAKERIKNALLGLVMTMAAWLILYTVNPNLIELDFTIVPPPTAVAPTQLVTPTAIYKVELCNPTASSPRVFKLHNSAPFAITEDRDIYEALDLCRDSHPTVGTPVDRPDCRGIIVCRSERPEISAPEDSPANTVYKVKKCLPEQALSGVFILGRYPIDESTTEGAATISCTYASPTAGMSSDYLSCGGSPSQVTCTTVRPVERAHQP